MMSILLGFVLNRMPSRNPRKHNISQYKKAKHSGLLYSRHVLLFKMVYGMYVICRRAVRVLARIWIFFSSKKELLKFVRELFAKERSYSSRAKIAR